MKFNFDDIEKKKAREILNSEVEVGDEGGMAAVIYGSGKEMSGLTKNIHDKFNKLENEGYTKNLETYLEIHKEIKLSKNDPEMMIVQEKINKILEIGKRTKEEPKKKSFSLFPKSSETIEEKRLEMKGLLLRDSKVGFNDTIIEYIDGLGNIVNCKIDFEKIDEYKKLESKLDRQEKIIKELNDFGFWGAFNREGRPSDYNTLEEIPDIFKEQYAYDKNNLKRDLSYFGDDITKVIEEAKKIKRERLEKETKLKTKGKFNF